MWQRVWNKILVDLGDGVTISFNQVILAIIVFLSGYLVASVSSRLFGRQLTRRHVSPGVAQSFQRAVFYTLLVAVIFTTLRLLHIPLTMFAFLGGAVAIGVGFGAQNVINNFISGWILLAERQVRVGDVIEFQGHIGTVDSVANRSTKVRRTDGVDMLVPNSTILEQTIINWTLTDKNIRSTVRVGVQYGSPTGEVSRLIYKAIDEHDAVLKSPPPLVIFEDFGDNALIFDVYFWCQVGTAMELRQIRSDIRFRIDELFRESHVVIAFPQRDVHVDTIGPLEVRIVEADRNTSRGEETS